MDCEQDFVVCITLVTRIETTLQSKNPSSVIIGLLPAEGNLRLQ